MGENLRGKHCIYEEPRFRPHVAHGGASLLCVLSIIIQKPVYHVGVHRMYLVLCCVVFLLYAAPDYTNLSNIDVPAMTLWHVCCAGVC